MVGLFAQKKSNLTTINLLRFSRKMKSAGATAGQDIRTNLLTPPRLHWVTPRLRMCLVCDVSLMY